MEYFQSLLDLIFNLDSYLFSLTSHYGTWVYLILFLIVFCETGLVIFPFLPGDSLLFASGSIAAQTDASLNIFLLMILLILASLSGNQLNYLIGKRIGPQIFSRPSSRFLNKKYLDQVNAFYEKHGGKTIIIARFIPIFRTFAPFIAGIGYMNSFKFFLYNLSSAILWIASLLCLGYFVGTIPFVKHNFSLITYSIVALSVFPPVLGFFYRKLIRIIGK